MIARTLGRLPAFVPRSALLALPALLAAAPAWAYVGPGAGIAMLGSLFAVIAAIVLAIGGILIFPVRIWLRKRRQAAQGTGDAPGGAPPA